MAFSSQIYKDEPIIHDTTPMDIAAPPQHGRGLQMVRGVGDEDYAYEGAAERFPSSLIIPKSTRLEMIREREERKNHLSHNMRQANLKEKDQDGLPYCWIFGPTQAVEVIRLVQGQPYVELCATSAGAQIKNFRSEGGWGLEGLRFISDNGLVPTSNWPECKLNRQYLTEENKRIAKDYRVTEWWELKPRSIDELMTCLLLGHPVAVGYNWWSHEVLGVEPIILDGDEALRIRNQWNGWGDRNFGILQGNRMIPDDAVAPRVAVAA